jgi:hypothetical protein
VVSMRHAVLSMMFVAVVIVSTIEKSPVHNPADGIATSDTVPPGPMATPILGTQTSNEGYIHSTRAHVVSLIYATIVLDLIWLMLSIRWAIPAGRWLLSKWQKR